MGQLDPLMDDDWNYLKNLSEKTYVHMTTCKYLLIPSVLIYIISNCNISSVYKYNKCNILYVHKYEYTNVYEYELIEPKKRKEQK